MGKKLTKKLTYFHWLDIDTHKDATLTDAEKYNGLVGWAGQARGRNPTVFDVLTEWILDDSEWGDDKLAENERILMQGVLARFKEQNAKLRAYLKGLEPSGVVNAAVFKALDIFDDELAGHLLSGSLPDERLQETVATVFADFSRMRERGIRELIAGNKTGPHGVSRVDIFGYINYLKGSDAAVQWALFMPDAVKRQQKGFTVDSFEYKKMPAMRFIGKESAGCWEHVGMEWRKDVMRTLDAMTGCSSGFDYDVALVHHYGQCVDTERNHDFWGRFMKADTPVPEGFIHFDFVPHNDGAAGAPFLSQFALATFSGDADAMHRHEGYDVNGMYDVTRNILLGTGVPIPYPGKYWTAEAFLDGCDKPGTAFMFSIERK